MSSAVLVGFTDPPYWIRTDGRRLAPRRPGDRGPDQAHTAWASSGVAVRPVPIAQIGS